MRSGLREEGPGLSVQTPQVLGSCSAVRPQGCCTGAWQTCQLVIVKLLRISAAFTSVRASAALGPGCFSPKPLNFSGRARASSQVQEPAVQPGCDGGECTTARLPPGKAPDLGLLSEGSP